MKKFLKKAEGFTLVELIVVIAILGILAGVAIPAYSGYMTKARDAAVITELDAIQTAVLAANAAGGAVTGINLNGNGESITIIATGELASTFGADFDAYYGGTQVSDTTYKLTEAVALAGTSYEDGAIWANGKWEPMT